MPKKKTSSGTQTSGERLYYLHQRGFKFYPVSEIEVDYVRKQKSLPYPMPSPILFQIEVEQNGKTKLFPKKINQKEINDALAKTVNYYYNLFRDIEIAELAKKENEKKTNAKR